MLRETAQQIDEEAAAWAARVDRGLSSQEEAQLEDWLAGDIRRPGAYARVSWTMMRTERAAALGSDFQVAQFRKQDSLTLSRRHWLMAGGGALAASLAGVALWKMLSVERYVTRKGEMRVVSLEDGSAISLNTATTLEVAYSAEQREIRLIDGEALFDVAKDPTRPFVVHAGDTAVRAVGTSFTVAHLQDRPVKVLVREGVVELSRPSQKSAKATRLRANDQALAPVNGMAATVTPLSEADLGRELAWRDGRLVFDGETLASAAEKFLRYSETRIIVDDPAMAREEIAGIYQLNDPVGFAQSVSLSLNGRADVRGSEVHILR